MGLGRGGPAAREWGQERSGAGCNSVNAGSWAGTTGDECTNA
jgi:hypothetical protein